MFNVCWCKGILRIAKLSMGLTVRLLTIADTQLWCFPATCMAFCWACKASFLQLESDAVLEIVKSTNDHKHEALVAMVKLGTDLYLAPLLFAQHATPRTGSLLWSLYEQGLSWNMVTILVKFLYTLCSSMAWSLTPSWTETSWRSCVFDQFGTSG